MPKLLSSPPRGYLRRYMSLPAAIHMLKNKSLTLLDPATWDDTNDSFFINEYKQRKGLETTLAACLSRADETYHHWKVFAGNDSGVCVRLRQGLLIDALKDIHGITIGDMEYRKINDVKNNKIILDEYPFLKRQVYSDEREVRIFYEHRTESLASLDIPIPIDCFSRITLSPWLPKPLVKATKELLKSVNGFDDFEIYQSSLINSESWKNKIRPRSNKSL